MRNVAVFFLGWIGCLQSFVANAQWYNPDNMNKKAQTTYYQAIENLRGGEWEKGRNGLYQTLKQEPKFVEAWLSLMGAYGEKKRYDSAIISFKKAWDMDSVFSSDYLLSYSINLAGKGNFEQASFWVRKYQGMIRPDSRAAKAAAYRKGTYDFAIDFAKAHQNELFDFNPINLGDSINSIRSEYYPSFTINDSLLVFTRRMQGIREDFYQSTLQPNGSYTLAKPIAGALNEEPAKGGINMSPDGDWLFFAGNFATGGFGDFDIYFCQATPQGWSTPYNLGNSINTESWESSPSISPDKQTLYFSSNRPGGYGGKDLYMSKRRLNGSWEPAENMGPQINSAADDLAPFIHADNQTLYFTSGGHPGYGGSDLYVAHAEPDGKWSKPENLGFPINTIDDDGSLIVSANGSTAYFSSFRSDSRGQLDLYRFELPTYARARKTQWVRGKVYDKTSGKSLPSVVEITDLTTGQLVNKLITDETGNYLITLPAGKNYSFTVSRKGYLFFSERFTLEKSSNDSSFSKDIPLEPILVNASFELKNIEFKTGLATLEPASFVELDKLTGLLKENEGLRVEIGGHTDNVGVVSDNQKLSEARAKSVVQYLINKGIDSKRLTAKGYGSSKPIADNTTELGRAKNRRTEMKVLAY